TLGDLELDALRLLEGAVTLGLDGGAVDEDVVTATVLGDEAVALLRVEPLDGSLCHVVHVLPGTPLGRALCSLHWCRNASPHVSASGRHHRDAMAARETCTGVCVPRVLRKSNACNACQSGMTGRRSASTLDNSARPHCGDQPVRALLHPRRAARHGPVQSCGSPS